MIELSGAVESNSLAPLLCFVAGLGRSGRLRVTRWHLAGDIEFRDGTVVDAVCGAERGTAALDCLLVLPGRTEFSFAATPPAEDVSSLDLRPDDLRERLGSLEQTRRRIARAVPSLSARACRASVPEPPPGDTFTMTRGEIALLLSVDGERTVVDLVGTDVLGGLKALTDFVERGFIRMDEVVAPLPSPPAVRAKPKLPSFSVRHLAWAAVVLFVIVMGAAQLADLFRELRNAFP